MRRVLRNFAVFGLLGAAIATATAWGLACVRPEFAVDDEGFCSHSEAPYWWLERRTRLGRQRLYWHDQKSDFSDAPGFYFGFGETIGFRIESPPHPPSWTSINWRERPDDAAPALFGMIIEAAAGWPMLSLRGAAQIDVSGSAPVVSGIAGVPLDRNVVRFEDFYTIRILPMRPIWLGLVGDSAFYGVIVWLLWFTPVVIKRMSWRRRGACARCGYDLRADEHVVCPECGMQTVSLRGRR